MGQDVFHHPTWAMKDSWWALASKSQRARAASQIDYMYAKALCRIAIAKLSKHTETEHEATQGTSAGLDDAARTYRYHTPGRESLCSCVQGIWSKLAEGRGIHTGSAVSV